eukprot:809104-Pelagomonas_calceolata.AAC.8
MSSFFADALIMRLRSLTVFHSICVPPDLQSRTKSRTVAITDGFNYSTTRMMNKYLEGKTQMLYPEGTCTHDTMLVGSTHPRCGKCSCARLTSCAWTFVLTACLVPPTSTVAPVRGRSYCAPVCHSHCAAAQASNQAAHAQAPLASCRRLGGIPRSADLKAFLSKAVRRAVAHARLTQPPNPCPSLADHDCQLLCYELLYTHTPYQTTSLCLLPTKSNLQATTRSQWICCHDDDDSEEGHDGTHHGGEGVVQGWHRCWGSPCMVWPVHMYFILAASSGVLGVLSQTVLMPACNRSGGGKNTTSSHSRQIS